MFQKLFLKKILRLHDNQAEALQKISELLFLNKSNVYRRLSGHIALKPQEIEMLAKHYNISLDELIYQKTEHHVGTITSGNNIDFGISYLKSSLSRLEAISQIPDFAFYHAEVDFSYIYFCEYPELFYFKTVQWKRLLWKVKDSFQYNFQEMSEEEKTILQSIQKYLEQTHWASYFDRNMTTLFLEQIRYTYEMGVMSHEDTLRVLSKFKQFINDLEKKTALGTLGTIDSPQKFEAYYLPIPKVSSLGLGMSPKWSYLNCTFIAPNFIRSEDPKLIQLVAGYLKKLKSKSVKITQAGELERRKLFKHYRRTIQYLRKEIENS